MKSQRVQRPVAALAALALVVVACDSSQPDGESVDPPSETEDTELPEPQDPPEPDDPVEPDPPPELDQNPPDDQTAGQDQDPDDGNDDESLGTHGVSAGHPAAVDAGMQILNSGGNAVDAAVAGAFAVSVAEPFTSGIGGGGGALVIGQDGDPDAYDYRETVPAAGIPDSNTGVPGFVAGMAQLHDNHGQIAWADVIAPAIELAEGTEVSSLVAERLAGDTHRLAVSELPAFYPDGTPLPEGATMVQDELADTLRTIADEGAEAFYTGSIADGLVANVAGFDHASLADYEVQHSEPPTGGFGDYEIVGAAAPLGGTTLIQTLQISEAAELADLSPNSADFVHTLASSWQIALAYQEQYLGDPTFVDVPVQWLTDAHENADRADDVTLDALPGVDPSSLPESAPNTTHLTVVDASGSMVSMTNTITNFWGSAQYEQGFFLNDHLARFDLGVTEANDPEPGKRPVTWSMPTIVADDEGRPVLGLGTPGGARIPNVLSSAIASWALHDQPLAEVVDAPRFNVDENALYVEEGLLDAVDSLLSRGWGEVAHEDDRLYFGSIQALEIDYDNGEIIGATDARREADHRIESDIGPVG